MNGSWTPGESMTLPPRDAWLIRPGEKIKTPTDDRGIILIDQLIKDVKETIDPSFEWQSELSVHHIYWPDAWYVYDIAEDPVSNPAIFRNLPPNKALVTRVFENWLHVITMPPPVPDTEVMRYYTEAWLVARDLFKMVRKSIKTEKLSRKRAEFLAAHPNVLPPEFNGEDKIGKEIMQEAFEKNFRGIDFQLKRQEHIPAEFRLVEFDGSLQSVGQTLGRLATSGSRDLVRATRLPLAA